MYIPSQNFEKQPECDIFCPWTGESYVYVEDSEKNTMSEKMLEGALELLPERFFKRPMPMRCPDGQVKMHVRI